jgi:hypothetical protein
MPSSSVYFIQAEHGGPIKIGVTDRPDKRVAQLQIASPHKLVLLRAVPGEMREEKYLHERFTGARLSGEWFKPTAALLRLIESRPFDWDAVVPEHGRVASAYDRDSCRVCGFRLDIEYEGVAGPERPDQCRACIAAAPYRESPETDENTLSPSTAVFDVPLR